LAQTKKEIQSFYDKFDPVEIDLLHIYTTGPQEKATYDPKSNYPFKGKAIDPSITPLLGSLLDVYSDNVFFSICRYTIQPNLEHLMIRIYHKETLSNSIHTLIYNTQTKSIKQGVLLADDYQSEGGSGAEQSWLLDLNEDGFTDILTRNYYDKYELKEDSDDLLHIHKEESYLVTFEGRTFKNTLIKDKNLQQSLEKEFPFRAIQAPFMKESTQKEILKLLKRGGLVIPSEND
jgi:hypothetical protein